MDNKATFISSQCFSFNGQEKDDEIKGEGNQLDFKFRGFDARLGRFFSVDPLTKDYPWYTPYQFAGNTPIQAKDIEGLEPAYVNKNNYFVSGSDHTYNFNNANKPLLIVPRPSSPVLPLFSKDQTNGIRAFGVTLEGPNGIGGLMGEGPADGALKGGTSKKDLYGALDFVGKSLKVIGTTATLAGQPEVGIPITKAGDKISSINETIKIFDDVQQGNTNSALVRSGALVLGAGVDKGIDRLKPFNPVGNAIGKSIINESIDIPKDKIIETTKK